MSSDEFQPQLFIILRQYITIPFCSKHAQFSEKIVFISEGGRLPFSNNGIFSHNTNDHKLAHFALLKCHHK